MAQAVFEEHPLEQYLREAGETSELMPGNAPDFMAELEESTSFQEGSFSEAVESIWSILAPYTDILLSYIPSHMARQMSPFAERFKYDVISSSLLATSLPIPHSISSHSPSLPGRLDSVVPASHQLPQSFKTLTLDLSYWLSYIPLAVAILFMSAGCYYTGILVLAGTTLYACITSMESHPKPDLSSVLEGLHDLIIANNAWDSVVHETVTLLEKEEEKSTFGPRPTSPPSSLRVALSSTLHTTQTQCDNVRQLLIALTSPNEFSQLSEMYAPPSPIPSRVSFSPPSPGLRLISLPSHQLKRTSSFPPRVDSKRTTWNGSYSTLASAGSPTMQALKRREKRRSDLSAILNPSGSLPLFGSTSVPSTPSLAEVQEEEQANFFREGEDSKLLPPHDEHSELDGLPPLSQGHSSGNEEEIFGVAALGLRRQRKSGGLESFGLTSPRYLHSASTTATAISSPRSPNFPPISSSHLTPRTPRSAASTISSSSKFTTMQTPRHPLSLSTLNQAIQGALSSKRYACSHLLALRFDEEDGDEGYWEDVRSVMSLLTSSIADASARLVEALDQVEAIRLKDENPSPESLAAHSRSGSLGDVAGSRSSSSNAGRHKKARTMGEMVSFAPIPSHLSRFAAHVDAISSALNDARDNLEECVAALREELSEDGGDHRTHLRRSSRSGTISPENHPSLAAYERLRRELGLALRECERGREKLLDLTMPPRGDETDAGDFPEDVPGLSHDASDESDKPDSYSPADDEVMLPEHGHHHVAVAVAGDSAADVDDVTSHLLLSTSSSHLPPPGLEQVFESEAGNAVLFNRERSKLSREERIQLSKKARESGRSVLSINLPSSQDDDGDEAPLKENTGPGVDVVQELKDVIWKVGERRRRLASDQDPGPRIDAQDQDQDPAITT